MNLEKRWATAAWLVNLAALSWALILYISIDLPGLDEKTGYSGMWRWAYEWQQGWGAALAAAAAGIAAAYTILQTKRIARLELEASRNRDVVIKIEERRENIRNHQRQCSLILRKLDDIERELTPFYEKLTEFGLQLEFAEWRWGGTRFGDEYHWSPMVADEVEKIWEQNICPWMVGIEFECPPTYPSWLNCHQNQNAALGFDDEMIDLCDLIREGLETIQHATPYRFNSGQTPSSAVKWLANTQTLALRCKSFLDQLQWQMDVENAAALPYERWLAQQGGSSEVFFESIKNTIAIRNKRPTIWR